MTELVFVTGNDHKFHTAQVVFAAASISLKKVPAEIDEIQSENTEKIARDKANKAYQALKVPLVINDDSWSIHGLNGFPGPYMKSINSWFTPEDFIRLTSGLKDRTVTLHQITVYQDESGQKVFKKDIDGMLLNKVSNFPGVPWMKVVSLTNDNQSLAEVRHKQPERLASENDTVWNDVVKWLLSGAAI